jgi:alternate F1F0 ATPase F1 subunit epsilon
MTVRVYVPSRTHSFAEVQAVDLATVEGHHMLLPRHVDCAGALDTGLIRIVRDGDEEHYVGVDGGTFVKIGDRVMVSTPRAVVGRELGSIFGELEERRAERLEQQKHAQAALARLEVEMARSIFQNEGQL